MSTEQEKPEYKIARHLAGLISALVELIPGIKKRVIETLAS